MQKQVHSNMYHALLHLHLKFFTKGMLIFGTLFFAPLYQSWKQFLYVSLFCHLQHGAFAHTKAFCCSFDNLIDVILFLLWFFKKRTCADYWICKLWHNNLNVAVIFSLECLSFLFQHGKLMILWGQNFEQKMKYRWNFVKKIVCCCCCSFCFKCGGYG